MEHFSFSHPGNCPEAATRVFAQATQQHANKFYDGEGVLLDPRRVHLELKMAPAAPFPMGTVKSRSHYAFRRTWDHIRDNKENVVTLRYVRAGSLCVSQGGNVTELNPGELTFTKSNLPFCVENIPNNRDAAEWVFVLFPLDVSHRHFPNGVPIGKKLTMARGRCSLIPTILSLLVDEGEAICDETKKDLVSSLLRELASAADEQGAQAGPRQSIGEKRIEQITAYVTLHMANPELSFAAVAQACKISQRYLSHLLKENGTTFSALLWTNRLNRSREWLLSLDRRHYGISEIAFMTGFKSVSHFSRMFRDTFGCSPREFRQREAEELAA